MNEKEIKKLLDKFNAGNCTVDELERMHQMMHEADEDDIIPISQNKLKEQIWENIEKDIYRSKNIKY